jgi:hypothetical protein
MVQEPIYQIKEQKELINSSSSEAEESDNEDNAVASRASSEREEGYAFVYHI